MDLAPNAALLRWLECTEDSAQRHAVLETLELLAALRPREATAALLLERVRLHLRMEQGAVLAPAAAGATPEVLAGWMGDLAAVELPWGAASAVLESGKSWLGCCEPWALSESGASALFGAVVPIARAGRSLGALCVAWRGLAAGSLSTPDVWLLEVLAGYAGIAFENAHELQRRAEHDALTGVANHGRFWQVIEREVERAGRYGGPLSAVMLDLDDFKGFNDAFGHLPGDRALRAVAAALGRSSRASDTVARYGGEEFAAVLPQTSLAGALAFAGKAIAVVRELGLERPDGGCLTLSAGAAELQAGEDPRALVSRADRELYRAKSAGGDCVSPRGRAASDPRI